MTNAEKLLVLFFLLKNGLPPWADNKPEKLAARLFGWTDKQADEAIAECHLNGWISPE